MKLNTAAEPTLWLKKFEIEISSGSNQVYNNGRQQIAIALHAEPQSGQVITDEQRQSLTVAYQDDDGEFQVLPLRSAAPTSPWSYSKTLDEKYDYFPSDHPAPTSHDHDLNLIERCYIHSTARANSKLTLYARIQQDKNDPSTIYYTEVGSSFDSQVDLYARSAPIYRFPDDYAWDITRSEGDTTGGSRFYYEYSLSPRNIAFSHAVFSQTDTRGMIRWADHDPGQTFASHVGLALPGNRTLKYDEGIRLPEDFKARIEKEVKTSNRDSLVVLIQGDNAIPYYSDGFRYGGPCTLTAYDRYGNAHRLTIAFDTTKPEPLEQRTQLIVTSRSESAVVHTVKASTDRPEQT